MIQPGLERISQLLKNVQFPWKSIHVAGTNGKGSICYYASSLLARRPTKCGKFTSPHLVNRWDCISINNEPVHEDLFRRIEAHYTQLSEREGINASSFEILTATAFHIFNEKEVEIGVVEVGMGGKLDSTNILNNQAVSVISKIARDHQSFLGDTLEEIALHKAGILRPNVPYIVNPLNEWNVQQTIDQYAKEIGAGPRLTGDTPELRKSLYSRPNWHRFAQSLRPFQQDNAVLATVAVKEALRSSGLELSNPRIAKTLAELKRKSNPGRLQYVKVRPVFGTADKSGREILVDGAHNPDAAKALDDFVSQNERQRKIPGQARPRDGWPVTWVLAMTEGKDARQYLQLLLQPGDNVITTSFGPVDGMPWVKPMDPKQLLDIAKSVQPMITGLHMDTEGVLRALCAAKYLTENDYPIVLTGSLYLVGDFHRELRTGARANKTWWINQKHEDDRSFFRTMHEEERLRINRVLSRQEPGTVTSGADTEEIEQAKSRRRRRLQDELDALDRQMESLEAEEHRISRSGASESKDSLDDTASLGRTFRRIPKPKEGYEDSTSKPISPKEKFFDDFEDLHRKLEVPPVSISSQEPDSRPSANEEDERNGRSRKASEDIDGRKVRLRIHRHFVNPDSKRPHQEDL